MDEGSRAAEPGEVALNVKRVIASPPPTPKLLTRISFSRVGPDLTLEAGFIDPIEIRTAFESAKAKGPEVIAGLYITDRFVVPLGALPDFLASLKILVADLESIVKMPSQSDDTSP